MWRSLLFNVVLSFKEDVSKSHLQEHIIICTSFCITPAHPILSKVCSVSERNAWPETCDIRLSITLRKFTGIFMPSEHPKKENSAPMRWLCSERKLQHSSKFSSFQRPRFKYYTVGGQTRTQ